MHITRHEHVRYMAKWTPLLIVLYVLQAILYAKYAPPHLSSDMNVLLGVGLSLIILGYNFYDYHHKVSLKPNFIEVRFDLLKVKEEILYQHVHFVEIKKPKQNFANMALHLRDGSVYELYHVDSPHLVADFIEKKKSKQ